MKYRVAKKILRCIPVPDRKGGGVRISHYRHASVARAQSAAYRHCKRVWERKLARIENLVRTD